MKEFFRTYYSPSNASIAIVGDFNPAEAKSLVERYFGPLLPGPQKAPVTAQTTPLKQEVREVLHDQVQLTKVILGWVGPRPLEVPAMPILMRVLAGGKSSRLYHDLVYRQKVAQDVSASWDPAMALGGLIEITATVQAGHTPQEVEQALLAELKRLREEPVDAAELARARRNQEATLYAQLENVGGFGGKADQLDYYEMWAHDPGAFRTNLEAVLAASADEVQKAAQAYLRDEQKVALTVLPEAKPAVQGGAK